MICTNLKEIALILIYHFKSSQLTVEYSKISELIRWVIL